MLLTNTKQNIPTSSLHWLLSNVKIQGSNPGRVIEIKKIF